MSSNTGTVLGLVEGKYGDVQSQIDSYMATYASFVNALSAACDSIEFPEAPNGYGVVPNLNSNVHFPDAPDLSVDIKQVDTALPTVPTFNTDVYESTLTAPVFNSTMPTLNIPTAPDSAMPDEPSNPPAVSDVTIPDAPRLDQPSVPVMESINLPETFTPSQIIFEEDMPVFSALLPTTDIDYTEEAFVGTLASSIESQISNVLENGGTGMSTDYIDSVYEKVRLILDQERGIAYGQTMEMFASRGFTLPQGAINAKLSEIDRQFQLEITKLLDGLGAKQLELAYQAGKDYTTLGVQYNTEEGRLWNATNERLFNMAKDVRDAGVVLYNLQVTLYNSKLDAYKSAASVYATALQGESIKAEVYKSQIAGASLLSTLNKNNVDLFVAKIGANNQLVGLYDSQIRAIGATLEVDKTKLQVFSEQVKVYSSKLAAKETEARVYSAQLAAELSKVQVFDADVKAFTAQSEAYMSDAKVLQIKYAARDSQNNAASQLFKGQTDVYLADVEATGTENKINFGLKDLEVKNAAASAQVATAELSGDIEEYKSKTAAALSENESKAATYQIEVAAAVEKFKTGIVMLQGNVEVTAQLLSSAMASLNTSVSGAYQGSSSASRSWDETKSAPTSHNQHVWHEG